MFIQFTHTSTFRLLIACTVFILEVKFMNETETERYNRSSRICDVSRGFLKDYSDHVSHLKQFVCIQFSLNPL